MIWVYAICERPDLPPPRRRGLAQAPLEGIREGALLAIVSRHAHPPGEPALDALWVHERVVERVMADRALLPMRFGSKAAADDELRAIMASRHADFLAGLDRVRGRVELGVRAIRREDAARMLEVAPVAAPVLSGREYLMSRLRDGRRVEHAAADLDKPLAAVAALARRQPPRAADEVLRASYLVERADLARFRGAVERLQRARPDTAILCTGPWPPYSFVDGASLSRSPHYDRVPG